MTPCNSLGAEHFSIRRAQVWRRARRLLQVRFETYFGDYRDAFWLSGGLCLLAATLLLSTKKSAETERKPEVATVPA